MGKNQFTRIFMIFLGVLIFGSTSYGGESIQITNAYFDDTDLILRGTNFIAFGAPNISIGDTLINTCTTVTNTEIICDISGTPATASGTWRVSVSAGNSPHTNAVIDVYNQTIASQGCIPGDFNECYQGELGTRNVGICKPGTRDCIAGGNWSSECVGQVLPGDEAPADELCANGFDDDCDGLTDEDDPDCCEVRSEICDGLDDNCNGLIDENIVGDSCSPGVGECKRQGNLICTNGHFECNVVAGIPATETCNGVDDDCDGLIDEQLNSSTDACCRTRQECGTFGSCTTICTAYLSQICDNGHMVSRCPY